MLTLMISKSSKGTEIQIASPDVEMARKVYRNFLRASLKIDQCTKTLYQGPVKSGDYAFLIHCPGLDYELACKRVAQLWPEARRSYPLSLIGG